MPYVMDGGMMGWMVAVMLLIPSLTIALVAALLVWAVRTGRAAPDHGAPDAPLAILQRRYARGDLGTDEYERMRVALTKS